MEIVTKGDNIAGLGLVVIGPKTDRRAAVQIGYDNGAGDFHEILFGGLAEHKSPRIRAASASEICSASMACAT